MLLVSSSLPYANTAATVIFIYRPSLTALMDTQLRIRKEVARFGQLVDPIADKLLVTAALFTLVDGCIIMDRGFDSWVSS